jgi:hypothetical protein
VGNLILGATAGIGTMTAEQDFDEYNAMIYSGKLSAQYDFENSVFVRGALGGMVTAFDIDNVFVDNKVIDNPKGYAVYSVVDMGLRWHVVDDVTANVFAGIDTENVYIEEDGTKIIYNDPETNVKPIYHETTGEQINYVLPASFDINIGTAKEPKIPITDQARIISTFLTGIP